jgi:hypothetical protein
VDFDAQAVAGADFGADGEMATGLARIAVRDRVGSEFVGVVLAQR